MTTSTLELGPEILDTFTPTDYLLEGNQGIATIPDYPDYLLRWWPRHRGAVALLKNDATAPLDETVLCQQPQVLADIFEHADHEFEHLQEYGINTPHPGLDIIRFTADAHHVALEGIVQYSIVKRLHGTVLDRSDPRGIPLVQGYSRYLQDAALTGQVLWDVPKAQQQIIRDKSTSQSGDVITLIDTEPLVSDIDTIVVAREAHKYETALAHAAGHLHMWGVSLDLRGPDMDAVHDLAIA
jgi:hypothetical protein